MTSLRFHRFFIQAFITFNLVFGFGCATVTKEKVITVSEPLSKLTAEKKYALFNNEINHTEQNIGLSLSGGGIRSASFGIGVLAGLNDSEVLPQIDYISTVSGGGYAAYWYISSLYHLQIAKDITHSKTVIAGYDDLFLDCFPNQDLPDDSWILYRNKINHLYPETCTSSRDRLKKDYRFQNQVVQQSDLLNYYQDGASTRIGNFGVNARQWAEFGSILLAHVLSLPAHHFANTFFDWNWQISPLRKAYNNGLERAFGLVPVDLSANHIDEKIYYNNQPFLWMDNFSATDITFSELHQAYLYNKKICPKDENVSKGCNQIPYWIINTAANFRHGLCSSPKSKTFTDRIFEFTPDSYGSEQNGYVIKPFSQLSISDAVQISGAALDSQYDLFSGPVTAALLHAANFNLGRAIENYHPNSPDNAWQKFLPIPFYCFPASDSPTEANRIYLSDGAHVEHTGAYALIRRGVKNIIMVDASEDKNGHWTEVKKLASMLKKEHGLTLSFEYSDDSSSIALLDENSDPINSSVVDPLNAKQNIYHGKVTGFSPGFIDEEYPRNHIKLFLIKTGIVDGLLANNCENPNAYPCSVSRFIQARHQERDNECLNMDDMPFPNNSTTGMSAEMSVSIYFAFRDLGRFISKKIKQDKNGNLYIEKNMSEKDAIALLTPLSKCKEIK